MKKILAITLVILLLILSAPLTMPNVAFETQAATETFTEGDYTYTVENGEATITDCNSAIRGDVTVPSTLGGYQVTKIGDSAFERIAGGAFVYIVIPEGVTDIGNRAFYSCPNLKSVTLPSTVKNLGSYVFDFSSINTINVDENNTVYSSIDGVLLNKEKTEIIRCPEGYNVKDYSIPDGVTRIGNASFKYCKNLINVTIPDTVITIGEYAFSYCTGIESVSIPNSVTEIEADAFFWCDNLKSVTIPDSVITIGNDAFYKCMAIENITIGNSVQRIEAGAFDSCKSIKNIYIPESVIYVEPDVFYGCHALTDIQVAENNPNYTSEDGVMFNKDKTTLMFYPIAKEQKTYTIPETVTLIEECGFTYSEKLNEIIIPASVEKIEQDGLFYCAGLVSINVDENNPSYSSENGVLFNKYKYRLLVYPIANTRTSYEIPESVMYIEKYAFYNCKNLTQITISENVTKIWDMAFADCDALTQLTLPKNVNYIGYYAFYDCDSLTDITILNWEAEFDGKVTTYTEDATIHGYENSTAQEFAENYNVNFVVISCECDNIVTDKAVAPTCYKTGLTEGSHCDTCGKVYVEQEIVEKAEHTVVVVSGVEATCTKTGLTDGKRCSVCSKILVKREEIEKIPHTPVIDEGFEATCCMAGLSDGSHCSVCGEIIVRQQFIPALPHTVVIDEAVEATCQSMGYTEGKHCGVCGSTIVMQHIIDVLPHSIVTTPAVAATCTSTGLTEGKHCEVCGTITEIQQVTNTLPHTPVIDKAVEATCTNKGLTEGSHCSDCGEIIVRQQEISATGHNDYDSDGNCDNCGLKLVEDKEESFIDKIKAFFQKIIDFFKNLFK